MPEADTRTTADEKEMPTGFDSRSSRREFIAGLGAAAATAAGAPSDVSATEAEQQRERLRELADRGDGDRWAYSTENNLASVSSGLINAELDALSDNPDGAVEVYSVDGDGVPLAFEVSTPEGERIGNLVHLSPADCEALAVDLLEQAHAAREHADSSGGRAEEQPEV